MEPLGDPASGQSVQLIIKDERNIEIRVFAYTDMRQSGVPVIKLDRYEMDQTFNW